MVILVFESAKQAGKNFTFSSAVNKENRYHVTRRTASQVQGSRFNVLIFWSADQKNETKREKLSSSSDLL